MQDGKHLSYAQITQKKKEEREAKEAADRAAAAGASYNSNQSSVDVICGIEDSSKKNIKEQVAVKQNVHGMYIIIKKLYQLRRHIPVLYIYFQ